MEKRITYFLGLEENIYFFSKDHCQKVGGEFVPVTITVPQQVAPRPSLPDGLVEDKEDVKKVYLFDRTEVPNPHPTQQA